MTIEYRAREHGGADTILVECPLCGEAFGHHANRAAHFYREHTWEDLGR